MAEIFLVAGATGGVGQQLVSKLLLQNQHVRALTRDLAKARALLGENLELAEGDTRRIDTLEAAVQGVETVICATVSRGGDANNLPEQVDYEGVHNLVMAAKAAGVQRFLHISTLAATNPAYQELDWKRKGEDAVRASGLIYTIVRIGGLTDEPGGQQAITVGQGDTLRGHISRADVAEACLRALREETTRSATFGIANAAGEPPDDWAALFADLKPDAASARAG